MNGEAYRSKMEPENLLKDGKSCIGFSVDGVICYLYSQATFLQWSQSRPFIEFSRSTHSLGFLEPEPCSYRDLWSQVLPLLGPLSCPFIGTSGAELIHSLGPLEPPCLFIGTSWAEHVLNALGDLNSKKKLRFSNSMYVLMTLWSYTISILNVFFT